MKMKISSQYIFVIDLTYDIMKLWSFSSIFQNFIPNRIEILPSSSNYISYLWNNPILIKVEIERSALEFKGDSKIYKKVTEKTALNNGRYKKAELKKRVFIDN